MKTFYTTAVKYLKTNNKTRSCGEVELWHRKFKVADELNLERSLESRKQIALILPDYIARRVAYKFKHLSNLYIGKDALLASVIGFQLSGRVPMEVVSRQKAVEWAGLWNKWRILMQERSGRSIQYIYV